MKDKLKYLIFFLAIFLSYYAIHATNSRKENEKLIILHLVLSDGFLPDEKVIISVIGKKGDEKKVFSEGLLRLHSNDVNFIEVPIERGTFNLVKIRLPGRSKEVKHGFNVKNDVFLQLSVNLKNEFLFVIIDSLDGYD